MPELADQVDSDSSEDEKMPELADQEDLPVNPSLSLVGSFKC